MARRDAGLATLTWRIVNGIDKDSRKEFRPRALGLGPMLQSCGLAATAAFLQAKSNGEKPISRAYRATERALAGHVFASVGAQPSPPTDLVAWLGQNDDPVTYRRATAAAREFAAWLRRAAEALIPGGGG